MGFLNTGLLNNSEIRNRYKVFTALLNQTGDDNSQFLYIGTNYGNTLTIGVTYKIEVNDFETDFTVVGAPNNNVGTMFIATGTNPLNQDDGSNGDNVYLSYNTGTPVVTILENSIGNVWFTYESTGVYYLNSNGLFIQDKTYVDCISSNGTDTYNKGLFAAWNGQDVSSVDNIIIYSWNSTIPGPENYNSGKLEIRVYY